jgi:RimJ/RimL family protein N-acetyltransferase
LYDFKVDSFCWGSWIIKNNSPSSFAIESAILVYEFGFDQLGFKQSHFDVRKGNKSVWNFHEKFGAIKTGENDIEYFYKINQDQFFNAKKKYKKFI